MNATDNVPAIGALVKLSFDIVNGLDNDHKGQILDVDENPDGPGTSLFLEISDKPGSNKKLHYYEGVNDGEKFAVLHRYSDFSGSTQIGENVEIEVVG